MRSGHFVDAVRVVRKTSTLEPETIEVLDTIATLMGAAMPSPYGAAMVGRVRAVLAGTEQARARKADKSPAQRARGARRPAAQDRTESVAVVEERATAKRSRKGKTGAKRCPQCGRGAGFGSAFCQYDGSALA